MKKTNSWNTMGIRSMRTFLTQCIKSIEDTFFPPFCLSCGEALSQGFTSLCETCFHSLALINYDGRCHRCFCPKEEEHISCRNCKNLPAGLYGQAACFESSGVTTALFSELKQGRKISVFSSYMMLQLDALKWPLPDIIIPTPGDFFDSDDGWKNRKIMAKELADVLQRPYSSCIKLKRHLCPVFYAPLESQPFFIENSCLLCSEEVVNKKVLLIHDEYKTGAATFLSAQKAFSCGALCVYSLSFTANLNSPFVL